MTEGVVVDSGIIISMVKTQYEELKNRLVQLKSSGVQLVTIQEVVSECRTVSPTLIAGAGIVVERTQRPAGTPEQMKLLDAIQGGNTAKGLTRADRALVGHAIARHFDILTMDGSLKNGSFREMLKQMDRLRDTKLPHWNLPEIEVLRGVRIH